MPGSPYSRATEADGRRAGLQPWAVVVGDGLSERQLFPWCNNGNAGVHDHHRARLRAPPGRRRTRRFLLLPLLLPIQTVLTLPMPPRTPATEMQRPAPDRAIRPAPAREHRVERKKAAILRLRMLHPPRVVRRVGREIRPEIRPGIPPEIPQEERPLRRGEAEPVALPAVARHPAPAAPPR